MTWKNQSLSKAIWQIILIWCNPQDEKETDFQSDTHLSQQTLHTSELRRDANERQGGGGKRPLEERLLDETPLEDILLDKRPVEERSFDERQEVVGWSWSKLKRWMLKREMEERRATERAAKR